MYPIITEKVNCGKGTIVPCISSEMEVLNEFNKKYAIIHTNSTYILIEKGAAGFILDSRSSLIHLHENNFFTNCQGNEVNKAKFWLKHPQRRTYADIVFDPTKEPTYKNEKGEQVFNIFKGFSVSPQQGDASPYWNHVLYIICGGNEEYYLYLRKYMACIIQKPKLLGPAIVLRGQQGTGKDTFVRHFGHLFGRHFLVINTLDHIVGRFNSHLQNAFIIFANEAIWGGNKKEIGALKGLISDPTIFIEGKGKDGFQIDNSRHLFVASNEDWAVPRDLDDRRFFVLDVSSKHKEDAVYFNNIEIHMTKNKGYEALLYDLQNEDISNFNPRIMPVNDAGFDMKLKGASTSEQYVYYALKEGSWHIAGSEEHWVFQREKSCNNLYENYKDWCESQKIPPQSIVEFGKTIKKLIPKVEKSRPGSGSTRPYFYTFPSIEECRECYQKHCKQTEGIWSNV